MSPESIHLIALILVCVFFVILMSYDYYEKKTGVPTFPTMPSARKRIAELLKAEHAKRGGGEFRVMDLGSGSGQLCRRVAKEIPAAQVVGVEISYIPWLRSVVRQKLFGPKNLEYRRADFWSQDVSDIDAMVTYLPGKIMERVGEKLRNEMKNGAIIIANGFPLRAGWEPFETMTVRVPFKMEIYLYRKK